MKLWCLFGDMKRTGKVLMQAIYCETAPLVTLNDLHLPQHCIKIESPPLVEWSESSHKAFPAAFKATTAAFLMSHQYWARHAAYR